MEDVYAAEWDEPRHDGNAGICDVPSIGCGRVSVCGNESVSAGVNAGQSDADAVGSAERPSAGGTALVGTGERRVGNAPASGAGADGKRRCGGVRPAGFHASGLQRFGKRTERAADGGGIGQRRGRSAEYHNVGA